MLFKAVTKATIPLPSGKRVTIITYHSHHPTELPICTYARNEKILMEKFVIHEYKNTEGVTRK